MISSTEGDQFEPVDTDSDNLNFILSFQEEFMIPNLVDDNAPIVVRALASAKKATNDEFYISAMRHINQKYPNIHARMEVSKLYNDDIRREGMLPEDVVNWLLSSHIHLIYSHVHQGKLMNVKCIECFNYVFRDY